MENNSTERTIEKLSAQLENKKEQLNQLFELSSEFSGILELDILTKLLIFTIESNFLIEKFMLIYFDDELTKILETNIKDEKVEGEIVNLISKEINAVELTENYSRELYELGVKLIIPVKINNETRGLILLGDKKNKSD